MHLTGSPFDISGIFPSRKGAGISASLLWVSHFSVSIDQNPSLIHNTKGFITLTVSISTSFPQKCSKGISENFLWGENCDFYGGNS